MRSRPVLVAVLVALLGLGGAGVFVARVLAQPITCNILSFLGGATGVAPRLRATGCDTNISINLVPKGSGVVTVNGAPVVTGWPILAPDGTLAAPSYSFAATPSAGMYSPWVGAMDLVADGASLTVYHSSDFGVGPGAGAIDGGLFNAIGNFGTVAGEVRAWDSSGTYYSVGLHGGTPGKGRVFWMNPATFLPDLWLTRNAAAFLQLGLADAAAPVAQSLGVQSVVAGTTDTAGAAWLLKGSKGTGTGDGGSVGVQVAYPSATGNTQNALTTVALFSGSNNAAAGDEALISLTPVVNQSGTASYAALDLNLTRTSVGSGTKHILRLRVGGDMTFGVKDGGSGVGFQFEAGQADAPTCSNNCGTTVPGVGGNDTWMRVTMGSAGAPASPFTVTFNGTYGDPPACVAVASTTAAAFVTKVSSTPTTVVVTTAAAPGNNDVFIIQCGPTG